MAQLRTSPSAQFERVEQLEIELRGEHARAFEFVGGSRDTTRSVVCIAGMGANGRSFVRQSPLADDHFFLLLNSPRDTPEDVDPVEYAADFVSDFLDLEGLDRPILLASSFGGAVAATLALRDPGRLRALILVGAVLSRRQIPMAFPGFVDFLEAPAPIARLVAPVAAQIMGGFRLDRDARDEIVREARNMHGTELKRRLLSLLALDLLPRLHDLAVPTLVLHGTRDWLVPWRRGLWTAESLPHGRFVRIKGAGHLPYLSHADEFNARVAEFLSDLQ